MDGLVEDCSNPYANALELLQFALSHIYIYIYVIVQSILDAFWPNNIFMKHCIHLLGLKLLSHVVLVLKASNYGNVSSTIDWYFHSLFNRIHDATVMVLYLLIFRLYCPGPPLHTPKGLKCHQDSSNKQLNWTVLYTYDWILHKHSVNSQKQIHAC